MLNKLYSVSVYRRTCGDKYLIPERKWWRLLTCCSNTCVYSPFWRGEGKNICFQTSLD